MIGLVPIKRFIYQSVIHVGLDIWRRESKVSARTGRDRGYLDRSKGAVLDIGTSIFAEAGLMTKKSQVMHLAIVLARHAT